MKLVCYVNKSTSDVDTYQGQASLLQPRTTSAKTRNIKKDVLKKTINIKCLAPMEVLKVYPGSFHALYEKAVSYESSSEYWILLQAGSFIRPWLLTH